MNVTRARILLVEDEQALLQLLERYLRRMDFEVTTYSSSVQALKEFETAPAGFDLVMADLGMPEISGETLLTRMLEIRPDLLVLVCSGSPFYISSFPKAREDRVGFLQKPFSAEDAAGSDRKAAG